MPLAFKIALWWFIALDTLVVYVACWSLYFALKDWWENR